MNRTSFLMKTAAIFALIGAGMGAHIAGSNSYALRPIHAHILVVGWLTLFSFSIFYKVFDIPKSSKLANAHTWSAFIGTFGLTIGMWLKTMLPTNGAVLGIFIAGGSILLISFVLFTIIVFRNVKND